MQRRSFAGEAVGGTLVASAAIQFGIVVVLGKSLLTDGLSVATVLVFRYAIAAIVLVAALVVLHKPLLPTPGERLWALGLGGIGYAAESGLFFLALAHGTAAAVTLLFFTYPVYAALASWIVLRRGRPRPLLAAALAASVAGGIVVVVSSGRIQIDAAGIAFVVTSGLTYTAYLFSVERFLSRTHAMTAAMWVSASVSVALLVVGAAAGALYVPSRASEWVSLAAMGLASGGAFVCLIAGLQRIGPVRTSVIASAEPLAAAILAFAFLGETIGAGIVAGGLLILMGAVMASVARAPAPAEAHLP